MIYLIRDVFTTDRAAGSVNGTSAEPGPGTRVVADAESKLSISSAAVAISGGKAAPVSTGDPGIIWDSVSRSAGLCLFASDRVDATTGLVGHPVGWATGPTGNAARLFTINHTGNATVAILKVWDGVAESDLCRTVVETWNDYALVARGTGYLLLWKPHDDAYWRLLWITNSGTTATLIPASYNYNKVYSLDNVAALDLTQYSASWSSDTALATNSTAAPGANATTTMRADGTVDFTWTPGAGETLNLMFRRTDDDNTWILRCDQAGGTIKLYEKELGAETERNAGKTQVWNVGTPYRIVVRCWGQRIRTYVAGVLKHSWQSAEFNNDATGVKVSLAGTDLITWPYTVDLPNCTEWELPAFEPTSTNAVAAQVVPTYDGSGECTHPDVYYNASGWNGYKYWMAFTPYPAGNSAFENPSIVASNDGTNWVVPAGLVNPLAPAPGVGNNSDPDLVVDRAGNMWCIWRETDAIANDTIYAISSPDGINWSTAVMIDSGDLSELISPSIIWDGDQYVMFYIDSIGVGRLMRKTASEVTGPWSAAQYIPMQSPTGDEIWHINVTKHSGGYLCAIVTMLADYTEWMAISPNNGLTWQFAREALLEPAGGVAWDATQLYRAAIVETEDGFDLWYSARRNVPPDAWHIGRTTITVTLPELCDSFDYLAPKEGTAIRTHFGPQIEQVGHTRCPK